MSAKVLNGFTREQTVKRFLRHKESQQYFKHGGWTHDPEEADTFDDVVEATEACAQYGLTEVELALRLDAQSCDVFCTPIR